MFRRQQRIDDGSQSVPERAGYTKYYEHDGQLRAYANRSMFLAGLFGVIALGSLGFAIYVRLQPATVIRVSADGEATVVGGRPTGSAPAMPRAGLLSFLAAPTGEAAPADIEGRALVRKFLESYMRYTPTSVDKNLAAAINMMTTNLRLRAGWAAPESRLKPAAARIGRPTRQRVSQRERAAYNTVSG